MTIRLLAAVGDVKTTGQKEIESVESFGLQKIERLHIDLKPEERLAGREGAPVEISCRGPFLFDVLNRVATFSDRVDVIKPNADGPSDQIACDQMAMHFLDRNPAGEKVDGAVIEKKPGSLDLAAERLVCHGKPVIVTAPSRNMNARAPRIEYNLIAESIAMDGEGEVFLRQNSNEIHAQSLFYQIDKTRSIGQLLAQGPGRMQGQMDETSGQQLEAVWNNRLQVYPHNNKQVISLDGGAELKYQGVGQFAGARDILLARRDAGRGRGQTNRHASRPNDGPQRRAAQLASAFRQSGSVGSLVRADRAGDGTGRHGEKQLARDRRPRLGRSESGD